MQFASIECHFSKAFQFCKPANHIYIILAALANCRPCSIQKCTATFSVALIYTQLSSEWWQKGNNHITFRNHTHSKQPFKLQRKTELGMSGNIPEQTCDGMGREGRKTGGNGKLKQPHEVIIVSVPQYQCIKVKSEMMILQDP